MSRKEKGKHMLIYAFTDIHGDEKLIRKLKANSKKAEIVICTGDITIFENKMRKILQLLAGFGKPLLLIHGNHEDESELRAACKAHKNIMFIHKGFYEQDGFLFAGYGGGGFAMRDRGFEEFSKKIKEKAAGKKLVLLFHQPPYKNKTDYIWGEHAGSKSFSEFIKRVKPELALCGHLHENSGKHDKMGKTLVMNPGPGGKYINLK